MEIEVEALNKGVYGKRSIHIGKGKSILKTQMPQTDAYYNFRINLTYFSRRGDSLKGYVLMRGIIYEDDKYLPPGKLDTQFSYKK